MASILKVKDNNGNVVNIPAVRGPAGPVFTPVVSDDGTLTWSNDGGLENPAAMNIRGPSGTNIVAPLTLSAAAWTGETSPFSQVVTVSGYTITENSKVDLQPNSIAIAQLVTDKVSCVYIENDATTLTAYAIGAAPTSDITMQVTITEVASV